MIIVLYIEIGQTNILFYNKISRYRSMNDEIHNFDFALSTTAYMVCLPEKNMMKLVEYFRAWGMFSPKPEQ